MERRYETRAVQTYQPAYVEAVGRRRMGILRDLSPLGAGLQIDGDYREGQPVAYRHGNEPLRHGTVMWVRDDRIGIAHAQPLERLEQESQGYRSVRVPLSAPAQILARGRRCYAELLNIAQKGMCILTDGEFEKGTPATLLVGRHALEATAIAWRRGDHCGIRFSKPLSPQELNAILVCH